MKIYQIIGMREQYGEEFHKLKEEGNREAIEISNGYKNPLIVANILRCRVNCLLDKMRGK